MRASEAKVGLLHRYRADANSQARKPQYTMLELQDEANRVYKESWEAVAARIEKERREKLKIEKERREKLKIEKERREESKRAPGKPMTNKTIRKSKQKEGGKAQTGTTSDGKDTGASLAKSETTHETTRTEGGKR